MELICPECAAAWHVPEGDPERPLTCTACGRQVLVAPRLTEDAASAADRVVKPVVSEQVLPPHLRRPSSDVTRRSPDQPANPPPCASHRAIPARFALMLSGALLAVLACLLVAWHSGAIDLRRIASWFPMRARSVSSPEIDADIVWHDTGNALVAGSVSVRVDEVEVDLVRGKDEANRVLTSETPFLHVWLRIKNSGDRAVDYQSWYAPRGEVEPPAILIDHENRAYEPAWFEQLQSVRGHRGFFRIRAGEEIRDVVVFPLPEDFDASQQGFVRLQLDAGAVGEPSTLRFEIPRSAMQLYYDADGNPREPVPDRARPRRDTEDTEP